MKFLITGGGTGGHLYPALAVAEGLKRAVPEGGILFVGANRGLEAEEVPRAGFPFRGLDSIAFPRRLEPRSVAAALSFGRAVFFSRRIVKEFGPDVVFSTGGYASAPVVVAAWLSRVPIVLHEQNSIPGRTNRIASRIAVEVHLAFASSRRFFPRRGHLRLSGNPLRVQVTSGSRGRALRQFRLDSGRKTVLVLGGSQGAHSINEAIVEALPAFEGRADIQFLIQSGQRDHEWVVNQCRAVQVKTWVRRFIPNMGDAYELADLVVSRAGAMSIAEIMANGLPSILVPYPHAMGGHQQLNAEQMVDAGAAVLVEDAHLAGPPLAEQIADLLFQPGRLREMAINARRMARPDATSRITESLLRYQPGWRTRVAAPVPAPPRRATRDRGPARRRSGTDDRGRNQQRRGQRRGRPGGGSRSGGPSVRGASRGRTRGDGA